MKQGFLFFNYKMMITGNFFKFVINVDNSFTTYPKK